MTAAADAVHFLAIDDSWEDLRLKLVCTATKGAPCHKRHPDPTVDCYSVDDPDLIDTDRCWAVEWAENGGWETIQAAESAAFPMIPVEVADDDGPVLSPILPHPLLPEHAEPLNRLAAEIHANARAHGFWDGARNFGETVALAHAELSEALEEDRSGKPLVYEVDGKPEGVAVELVDCMIRCLDWLGSQGVDVDAVMAQKMAYNETRPHKHGKAY